MSQYIFNDSRDCLNTTNSYNTTSNVSNYYTVGDDMSPLLTWLSPLDPGLRHSDIQERRVGDVGEWLMGTKKFRRWCGLGGEVEDDRAVLFCYGNPGVGKTFISSLVADRLRDLTGEQHTAVACFYFDFAARKEQTVTSMLGSILKQVISGTERVPEDIWRALQAQKKAVSGRKPQLGDIVKILQLITSSQRTFMVIDALDECTAVQRFRLFDSLKEILDKSPGARIFVTGRPHICPEIETRLAGRAASISVGPARDDIIRFLHVRLSEDETPDAMDESLEADILEKIPGSISEMFLLASLNVEAILQEPTIHRRRERLNNMTDGLRLEDVYGATIERINAQGGHKSRLGMGALMWISYAERPLSPDDLCHALAIELGSTDFNADNIPSIATLVSCCQGLISMDKGEFDSRVRLVHFTLKEYFSAHPDIFSSPHSAMAEICLTYLNSKFVKSLQTDFSRSSWTVHRKPFLKYCSLYWGVHAKRELSDCARSLSLELLGEYDGHISGKFLWAETWGIWFHDISADLRFGGLHCASIFGIVELVAALVEMENYDINKEDQYMHTPLAWAAKYGHNEIVKLLVELEEVNPDKPDNYGQTPLAHAARGGHEGVVETLLWSDKVSHDKPDHRGLTPLSYAAQNGYPRVVKMLLGRKEVNPDRPSLIHLRTPLSWASHNGHEEVVKILLEREDVNPECPNLYGQTPLSFAAMCEHEGVVKVLLGLDEVKPDGPSKTGQTPLSYAAENGHEGVIKILLEREEVDPDKPCKVDRTPLSWASYRGHEKVVKMLLDREEVNPDKPDNKGRTPLLHAARSGHEGVVRILLQRDEVNADKPDDDGLTPLAWAARRGHQGVVRALRGHGGITLDKPENSGQTPHMLTDRYGYWG